MELQLSKPVLRLTCMTPITVKHESNYYTLPCGKCPKCYARRISQWSFRLVEEDKISSSSHFITLTYSDDNITRTKKGGYANLVKKDLQNFFKRLRKINKNKLKYFACGEYGSETKRPHYHIILFNCLNDTIEKAWSLNNKPIGHVHYGKVTKASIGYTLKYMSKESKVPEMPGDDRQREFQLISKRLGRSYITDQTKQYHTADLLQRMCLTIEDNKKISMPRYYKDNIYSRNERGLLKMHFSELARLDLEDFLKRDDTFEVTKVYLQYVKNSFEKMRKDNKKRSKI